MLSLNQLPTSPAIGPGNRGGAALSYSPDEPAMRAVSACQSIRTGGTALAAAALTARLQAGYTKLKIGAPDWNLKREAKPASIELAKSIGFDGVQISLGHRSDAKNAPAHLPVSAPELLDQ